MFYIAYLAISMPLAMMVVHPIFIEYMDHSNLERGSFEANTAYGLAVTYKAISYFLTACGIHHLALEFLV